MPSGRPRSRPPAIPPTADKAKVNWFMAELILVIMVIYVTMVYGPIAAFLVEMFPTKIRYTSMSLPYHIGNGWFGGMLPLLATAIVAATGDIYAGLWYPIVVAVMTLVIGPIFLRDTKGVDITTGSGVDIQGSRATADLRQPAAAAAGSDPLDNRPRSISAAGFVLAGAARKLQHDSRAEGARKRSIRRVGICQNSERRQPDRAHSGPTPAESTIGAGFPNMYLSSQLIVRRPAATHLQVKKQGSEPTCPL